MAISDGLQYASGWYSVRLHILFEQPLSSKSMLVG
jgi:hypothetical protein